MSPELQTAAVLCACDPSLARAGVEQVARLVPVACTVLRAILAEKAKPVLPEPAQRPPLPDETAWGNRP